MEWAFHCAPWVFRILPRCWTGVLCSSTMGRPAVAQMDSGSVGMCGGTCGLSAGAAGRASVDYENPPHVARPSTCWTSRGGSTCSRSSSRCGACSWCRSMGRFSSGSGSDRLGAPLARCRNLARPLALSSGHEVVAVAVATSIPEMLTLGGDDIVVVAWYPVAAGAGSTRQGADRALNCSKETGWVKLPTMTVKLSCSFSCIIQSSSTEILWWGPCLTI